MFEDIPIVGLKRDVIPLQRFELIALSRLHEFCAKYQITIVCKRCDHAITGHNTGNEKHPSVSCHCRQWIYQGDDL